MEIKRFGLIALIGRPNAGKSTLLNRLAGVPVVFLSPRVLFVRSVNK